MGHRPMGGVSCLGEGRFDCPVMSARRRSDYSTGTAVTQSRIVPCTVRFSRGFPDESSGPAEPVYRPGG